MRKEVECGSQGAIAGTATTKIEVLILSVDDWYLALSMADRVKATVDEEGVSMDVEGSRVDGGRLSQKDLIRETIEELLVGSLVDKALMAGRTPPKASEGSSRKTPGTGE